MLPKQAVLLILLGSIFGKLAIVSLKFLYCCRYTNISEDMLATTVARHCWGFSSGTFSRQDSTARAENKMNLLSNRALVGLHVDMVI